MNQSPNANKQQHLQIELNANSKLSKNASKVKTILTDKNQLKITNIEALAEGINTGIKVFASQKIATEDLKGKLIIKPSIQYNIESTNIMFLS